MKGSDMSQAPRPVQSAKVMQRCAGAMRRASKLCARVIVSTIAPRATSSVNRRERCELKFKLKRRAASIASGDAGHPFHADMPAEEKWKF